MPEWYYLDGGLWTPFDATITTELETIFQKDSSGKFADFTVDFHSMTLKKNRNKILIKRANMAANPPFAWEWEMNGQWHPYDFFDSDFLCLVESAPHLQTTVLYLGPQNAPYQIDTNSCTQKNMKTSYRRPIRKISIAPPTPALVAAPAPPPTSTSALAASSSSSGTAPLAAAPIALDLSGVSPAVRGVMVACVRFDCNEDCVICMEPFDDVNGVAHSLPDCLNHGFHLECIKNQLMSQGKCPICNKMYIINEGTQPRNGTMSVRTQGRSLPGYPRCGTIEITYNFPSGTQGPEHPNPGMRFSGTGRTAYLPDNAEGQEVLALLKRCFDKRLTFTVGRSVTTGQDNCVVWNGVHHKTSTTGGSSHFGYPDDTYLARVKNELAAKGFT